MPISWADGAWTWAEFGSRLKNVSSEVTYGAMLMSPVVRPVPETTTFQVKPSES